MEARVRSGHFRNIGVGTLVRFGNSPAARVTVAVTEVLFCKRFEDMFQALRLPNRSSWSPFLPRDYETLDEGVSPLRLHQVMCCLQRFVIIKWTTA